jgi:hypothetical protein
MTTLSYIIYYIDLWRQYCHAMFCVDLMILRMIYLGGQLCLWICFNLLFYFSYDWYVTVKTLFLFLNLCLSVKLDILSWSFSSMSFLTNCEYLFPCMDKCILILLSSRNIQLHIFSLTNLSEIDSDFFHLIYLLWNIMSIYRMYVTRTIVVNIWGNIIQNIEK